MGHGDRDQLLGADEGEVLQGEQRDRILELHLAENDQVERKGPEIGLANAQLEIGK